MMVITHNQERKRYNKMSNHKNKSKNKTPHAPRNHIIIALLKRGNTGGGSHAKTNKAIRKSLKIALKKLDVFD